LGLPALTLDWISPEKRSMPDIVSMPALACDGTVKANFPVSSGLIRLDLELDQGVAFQPGQFAMLNLPGPRAFVFSRPFSIFAANGHQVSFLYRRVGSGTEAMGDLLPGARMSFLGPLGKPFPEPRPAGQVVLIAGGVGLPPLAAWLDRYGASAPGVQAFFGARDGADVPWDLLAGKWQVSVDVLKDVPTGQTAWEGLVTDLTASRKDLGDDEGRTVLSCGPTPLLKAAARLASERRWDCWLSLEEHMGCGYGVCKGCVVPVHDPGQGPHAVRNATCCQEGPVFRAEDLAWGNPDSELPVAGRSAS
jgi:dihydroorotate dehydrogenase electron transfer subunit